MSETGGDYRQRLGRRGEDLAAEYLAERGYEVIERNVRRREGEIDPVALHRKTLVFVEVKLRSPGPFGGAVEALTGRKQRRLRELAAAYSADHPELPGDLRIDLVAIDLKEDGDVDVQHLESAIEG
ncbi:MAG: YraN family protein [Dehalococcoidia bacterium]|jgi:putative endonuclease|nr:YraN family protein [Dehalococcoidia bacterium]